MEALLGNTLSSHNGPVQVSSINAKFKLLYFSAHWCPPCRAFTPQLALFYQEVNSAAKQVEIIFVSADKSPDQFNEYFATMPWLSLPYEDRQRKQSLGSQFGIQGIPALVLLDNSGRALSTECRNHVSAKGPRCLADWEQLLNS